MSHNIEEELRCWLSDCCTCQGVSGGVHRATCPVSAVSEQDLDALWYLVEGLVEEEVVEELRNFGRGAEK